MNENNFSRQGGLNGNFLNVTLTEPIQLDNIAIKVLAEDSPDFFIPFRLLNVNDNVTLKYQLVNAIALEYATKVFDNSAFIDFYLCLLEPFIQCSDWFLDYHNIYLNPECVYLEKNMTQAQYIYIPEASYRNTDEEIVEFFRKVLMEVQVNGSSDFVVRLYQYFGRNNVLLTELYDMLKGEKLKQPQRVQPQPIPQPQPIQQPVSSGVQAPTPQPTQPKKPFDIKPFDLKKPTQPTTPVQPPAPVVDNSNSSGSDSADDMMALFGASSKKKKEKPKKEKAPKEKATNEKPKSSFGLGGLFGKKQNKNTDVITPTMPVQNQYQPVQQPQSYAPENQNTETDNNYYGFDDMGDSDETKYDGDMGTMAHLELLESSTVGAIQRISLDFQGNLTIGRMSNNGVQANILFNSSFKQISRMHAMIERKGNSYFIVDLGSANKTMLNNSVLIPNTPQPLNNGDRISFAVNTPVIYTVVL